MYDRECVEVFLREQGRLFDEPVAETFEEAENMDVSDITDDELLEELEVFKLPSGRYLIVEG